MYQRTDDIGSVEIGYSVLVKRAYNFFPGFLVDFFPAQSAKERKRNKGDRYRVHIHGEGEKSKGRSDIIFMVDDSIADCSVNLDILSLYFIRD